MRNPARAAAAEKKRVREAMDVARNELCILIISRPSPETARDKHNWVIALAIAALMTPDGDKLASEGDILSRSAEDGRPMETLPPGTTRDLAISYLRDQAQPPRQPERGPLANKVRSGFLADIIEEIRCLDFDPTRGDEARWKERELQESSSAGTDRYGLPFWLANACARGIRQSACSIVAAAWRELESEVRENRARPLWGLDFNNSYYNGYFDGLRNAFKSNQAEAKPLSERTLQTIWEKSEWWAKLHTRERRTSRR